MPDLLDAQRRLAELAAADREEKLNSYDAFTQGEHSKVLTTPAWRREAVLEREARLRAAC